MVASLRYLDTFVKMEGAWLFAERLLYVDWIDRNVQCHKGMNRMSAYVVFTRTKTIDQKELEKYWAGIKATMKGPSH